MFIASMAVVHIPSQIPCLSPPAGGIWLLGLMHQLTRTVGCLSNAIYFTCCLRFSIPFSWLYAFWPCRGLFARQSSPVHGLMSLFLWLRAFSDASACHTLLQCACLAPPGVSSATHWTYHFGRFSLPSFLLGTRDFLSAGALLSRICCRFPLVCRTVHPSFWV